MNEDFSDVISKFSDILKDKNIDLGNIMGGENSPPNNDGSSFDFDINTILKIKDIMGSFNGKKDSPRNKLLNSLKPYLEDTKKEKLEQYVQIANLLTVLDVFNNDNR